MNFKDRAMLLLSTIKEIWSGIINKDYYYLLKDYRLNTSGFIVSSPNCNLYYVKIPNGATSIKIISNAILNSSAAYQYGFIKDISNQKAPLYYSAANWTEATINIPTDDYNFFIISITKTCTPYFYFS